MGYGCFENDPDFANDYTSTGEYVAMLASGERPRPSTDLAQTIERVAAEDGVSIPWTDWFAPPAPDIAPPVPGDERVTS